MSNDAISEIIGFTAKLAELHNENAFKVKSLNNLSFQIDKMQVPLHTLSTVTISNIPGIGTGHTQRIAEIIATNTLQELEDLITKTPHGILEIMRIKGLGPKKIQVLWHELNIDTPDKLLALCKAGELVKLKGFGDKLQASVLDATQFFLDSKGYFLYAKLEPIVTILLESFYLVFDKNKVRVTGLFLRQYDTMNKLEFVIDDTLTNIKLEFSKMPPFQFVSQQEELLIYNYNTIPIYIHTCTNTTLVKQLFFTTGSATFNDAFKNKFPTLNYLESDDDTDAIIFKNAGIPYIAPCLREDGTIIDLALANKLPQLIVPQDIKGIIHNHSTYSDGAATLRQMAEACIEKGYEYFVISDHSQYASYAGGLPPEKIIAQHAEIDILNKELAPFKIFKSIECDILPNGDLDYNDEILGTFDIVVASVHSVLNMDKATATARLIKAIENPHTSILGHCSGRLLLSRAAYPLDMQAIINACAANDVVLELNASPYRLDMDWKWIKNALQQNVLIAINPDAHSTAGINDVRYGVLCAQKAGLTKFQNLSSYSLDEFEDFVQQQLQKRMY
jgi:DNA polymerase (family X)